MAVAPSGSRTGSESSTAAGALPSSPEKTNRIFTQIRMQENFCGLHYEVHVFPPFNLTLTYYNPSVTIDCIFVLQSYRQLVIP